VTAAAAPIIERLDRTPRRLADEGPQHAATPEGRLACDITPERAAQTGVSCRDIRPELIIELI
jgi:hypothetical protein